MYLDDGLLLSAFAMGCGILIFSGFGILGGTCEFSDGFLDCFVHEWFLGTVSVRRKYCYIVLIYSAGVRSYFRLLDA